ncbi:unnamed protein product [Microthlaspi erraticum]|uniref:Uncharacterized protein n=1 Tax=Microthlaspi erraticum TaxID=1685480 RepID=A0A6D2IC61_9BRAS|nr:unnamed protein product [Microthlaspi erraticum]
MADQIRALQDKMSCTASASGGVQRTAVGPRQAIPSEDDDEPDHDTTGGRPLPPEPPRHSSFEPRQQRKRRFGEPQQRDHQAQSWQTCHSGDAAPLRGRQRRQITHRRRELRRTSTCLTPRASCAYHRPHLHAGEHAGGSRRLHLRTPLMLSPDALDRPPPLYHSIFPFLFLLLSLFNSLLGFFSHRVGVK